MFYYKRLYIPTGKVWIRCYETDYRPFVTYAQFLNCINKWNASAPGVWQFWAVCPTPEELELT